MIKSFRHRGLARLFLKNDPSKIHPMLVDRCRRRLAVLNDAVAPGEANIPGFNFHSLRGKPKRYSVHVNGPWCITFEFEDGDAFRVDLEQYH